MIVRVTFALLVIIAAGLNIDLAAGTPGAWIDVPFVAQTQDGCGSASVSMVIRYWENMGGRTVAASADPEKIQAALFSRSAGGIPASVMRKYFQDAGYRVFSFQGEWSDLKHHIEQLYDVGRWSDVLQAVPETAGESADLELYRGLALSQLQRWGEARAAFQAGLAR